MRRHHPIRSGAIIGVLAVGLAMLMPTQAIGKTAWYGNQRQYAQVLNPLAASVMSWYGDLVESDRKRSREARKHMQALFMSAEAHSSAEQLYPTQMRTIEILDAALERWKPRQFAFRLDARLMYGVADQTREITVSETFVFSLAFPHLPKIIMIERLQTSAATELASPEALSRGDGLHYQLRQFAYHWLAAMDRNSHHASFFLPDALQQSVYEVEFGDVTLRGDVEATLHKRRARQGLGGHLLRSLTVVQPVGETPHLTIELIIDWKGKTPDGLSAIGKLRQEIRFVILADGQLSVIQIREHQLLPDLEPWTKLLC